MRKKFDDLTIDDRRAMAGALMGDCMIAKEKISLLVATEKAAESLIQAMESSSAALLKLPAFMRA